MVLIQEIFVLKPYIRFIERFRSRSHHLLVGNTNMAAFSLVYDTNMAAVTSLKTLYGLVIISLDCLLVPVRCRKKYRENAKQISLLVFFVCSCALNLLKYD